MPASVPATAGTPASTAARIERVWASAAGRARSLIQPGTLGPLRIPCGAEKVADRRAPVSRNSSMVASFQAAVRAGVRVVAGTDAGTPDNPHGGMAGEVAFMVEAGLDVLLAVKAATGEAADLLGVAGRGVLRQGAAADVLVAAGDVSTDVTALQRPLAVFQDGRRVV